MFRFLEKSQRQHGEFPRNFPPIAPNNCWNCLLQPHLLKLRSNISASLLTTLQNLFFLFTLSVLRSNQCMLHYFASALLCWWPHFSIFPCFSWSLTVLKSPFLFVGIWRFSLNVPERGFVWTLFSWLVWGYRFGRKTRDAVSFSFLSVKAFMMSAWHPVEVQLPSR